jgi:polyferredoxin
VSSPAHSSGKVIPIKRVGDDAVHDKGWLKAHRYLLLRRMVQLGIFAMFLLGPMAGVWIVKGNLSSSLTLGVLPLTDPFVLAQVLATRHWPELTRRCWARSSWWCSTLWWAGACSAAGCAR